MSSDISPGRGLGGRNDSGEAWALATTGMKAGRDGETGNPEGGIYRGEFMRALVALLAAPFLGRALAGRDVPVAEAVRDTSGWPGNREGLANQMYRRVLAVFVPTCRIGDSRRSHHPNTSRILYQTQDGSADKLEKSIPPSVLISMTR